MLTEIEISQLVQMTCAMEVSAPKPGNVNRRHDFERSTFEEFLLSGIAIGPAFADAGRSTVGEIILNAVLASKKHYRSNTNLGIILLLAPLAKACLAASDFNDIRTKLQKTLDALTIEDAELAYEAIRIANPGGLGLVAKADIGEKPTIPFLEAMAFAKERDSIAWEYATNYEITFEIGLPALKTALSRGASSPNAIVQAYLSMLSRIPDSHIARKKGIDAAEVVSLKAAQIILRGGIFTEKGLMGIEAFDQFLRAPSQSLNPGTSADLTAAAIFLNLVSESLPINFCNSRC